MEKPLYATCTAITDEKAQTMLLITLDMLHATMADFKPVKNGFYTFEAMDEKGNKSMLLIKDLQVAEKILSVESAQYLFDEQNVIVDIVR